MSSLTTLEYEHHVGFYYRRSPSGRIEILPEDVYTLDDDPTEAGETGAEWPAESGADHEGDGDEWLDDARVMTGEDRAA